MSKKKIENDAMKMNRIEINFIYENDLVSMLNKENLEFFTTISIYPYQPNPKSDVFG